MISVTTIIISTIALVISIIAFVISVRELRRTRERIKEQLKIDDKIEAYTKVLKAKNDAMEAEYKRSQVGRTESKYKKLLRDD